MTPSLPDRVLVARGIGKEYRIYDTPRQRLKSLVTGGRHYRSQWSLQDVSFELARGQCIGVIGDNGAGKSTLLKIMAGTLQPTTGELVRLGRVTAILELGAGFHPDFTGRENLTFAGGLIGLEPAQLRALEPEIVEFSELEHAMDRPVKTYSSGMVVRLAFALITALPPDLLIVDEALAVGDQHFQKKCMDRINAFRERGCSILFCSHSFYHIRHLCDQAIWLDSGRVQASGQTEGVLSAYEAHTRARDRERLAQGTAGPAGALPDAAHAVGLEQSGRLGRITSLQIDPAEGGEPLTLIGRDLSITVEAETRDDAPPSIALMLEQSHGVGITSLATHAEGVVPKRLASGRWRVILKFPDLPLHSGDYVVSAYLFNGDGLVELDKWYQHLHFRYSNPTKTPGLVQLPHQWL